MSQEQAAPPMPQPTAEHQALAKNVGRWKVQCKFFMDPSQPPMECEATETVEAVGPFWTLSKFEMDMGGMPFVGRATLGYEPHGERWVSTWADCMSPHLFYFTGCYDEASKTLTMTGDGWNCQLNAICPHRIVERGLGEDERTFEMYVTLPEAGEVKLIEHHYTRA